MRRFVSSLFCSAGLVGLAFAQESTAPPTLMPPFKGGKAASTPEAPSGIGRPVTLTPVFEMPKLQQPKPTAGWELKPEHGEWLIEVKSYAQVESGIMAEALAKEIREKYRQPVYLFEWGADARKKKEAEEALARKRVEDEIRPFVEYQAQLKAEAEARGEAFDETPIRTKVPVYYREIPDQYMVVVGGYKDIDTARKALDIIRKWPMPKDTRLLDTVETTVEREGRKVSESTYVNPFAEAKVVRNMTWPKQLTQERDEFLIRLNDGESMSILRSPKRWTLIVKSFNVPASNGGSETKQPTNSRGPMSSGGNVRPGQWLDATAQQAREFCKALREMKDRDNRPAGFDAFVMHHRTGTLVTIGEYETPEDKNMLADIRRIQDLSFNKNENKNNAVGAQIGNLRQKLFDGATPMLIPK